MQNLEWHGNTKKASGHKGRKEVALEDAQWNGPRFMDGKFLEI